MDPNWAAEHLQTIRTLMERSALYRRALAPIMIFLGALGLAAAGVGVMLEMNALPAFAMFWLGTAMIAVTGAILIARRQALKEAEPFWSPPTRRVGQAVLLPLTAGLTFGLLVLFHAANTELRWLFIFPNIFFYACAVHAAGHFMPRGMRRFGWLLFTFGAVTLLVLPRMLSDPEPVVDHCLMGFFFGALHLAYGVYLYFTEQGKNAA